MFDLFILNAPQASLACGKPVKCFALLSCLHVQNCRGTARPSVDIVRYVAVVFFFFKLTWFLYTPLN